MRQADQLQMSCGWYLNGGGKCRCTLTAPTQLVHAQYCTAHSTQSCMYEEAHALRSVHYVHGCACRGAVVTRQAATSRSTCERRALPELPGFARMVGAACSKATRRPPPLCRRDVPAITSAVDCVTGEQGLVLLGHQIRKSVRTYVRCSPMRPAPYNMPRRTHGACARAHAWSCDAHGRGDVMTRPARPHISSSLKTLHMLLCKMQVRCDKATGTVVQDLTDEPWEAFLDGMRRRGFHLREVLCETDAAGETVLVVALARTPAGLLAAFGPCRAAP